MRLVCLLAILVVGCTDSVAEERTRLAKKEKRKMESYHRDLVECEIKANQAGYGPKSDLIQREKFLDNCLIGEGHDIK